MRRVPGDSLFFSGEPPVRVCVSSPLPLVSYRRESVMFASVLVPIVLAIAPPPSTEPASGLVDFAARFGPFDGCFVLKEIGQDFTIRYKANRCNEGLSPCSTSKIFNSLIALDCGVATGPDMLLKWDGKPQNRKECEKDHTLRSAVRVSVVWYFQELARQIGAQRMQGYLNKLEYGNKDMSGGIDQFWLCSSHKISAEEQLSFMERLYTNRLPIKPEAMEQVRDLIVVDRSGDWVFSGKTGTGCSYERNDLGWFVGHLKSGRREFVFAANTKGLDAMGPKTRDIVFSILKDLRLVGDR